MWWIVGIVVGSILLVAGIYFFGLWAMLRAVNGYYVVPPEDEEFPGLDKELRALRETN